MADFYGEISLKKLGDIVRQHPELVRTVHFNRPTPHDEQMIRISIREKQTEYSDAFIAVSCKKEEQKEGLQYIVGNLHFSNNSTQQPSAPVPQAVSQPAAAQVSTPVPPQTAANDNLPF